MVERVIDKITYARNSFAMLCLCSRLVLDCASQESHRFATPLVARLVAGVGHGRFSGTSCSKDSASQAERAHSDPDPSAASRRIDSGERATDLDRLRLCVCLSLHNMLAVEPSTICARLCGGTLVKQWP